MDRSDELRIRAFAEKVKAMRDVQRRHFSGDRGLVPEAKRLEAEVDRFTAAVLDRQPSLFDDEVGR